MAIATATSLGVHMGGELLFGDVSFKLEPRERMTLSGRNAGSLVLHKGARVALHDQRPPRKAAAAT